MMQRLQSQPELDSSCLSYRHRINESGNRQVFMMNRQTSRLSVSHWESLATSRTRNPSPGSTSERPPTEHRVMVQDIGN